MKFIRLFVFALFFAPMVASAASSEFMMAAQLLAAAKNADVQQVQSLVNNGANINFVDSTGVSIVCTALMNNDVRAAQILQMYGADASRCDYQIKQYNNKTKTKGGGGLFSGLSSAQSISLAAAGAAVVVGGLLLLTDVFDPGNDNENSSSSGNRPDNNPNDGTTVSGNALFAVPYSPAYLTDDGKITTSDAVYQKNLLGWNPSVGGLREWDFNYFRPNEQPDNNYMVDGFSVKDGINIPMQNYLLMMHGYSAFANLYTGKSIFRNTETRNPVEVANTAGGGQPVMVGLVTANGVNPYGSLNRNNNVANGNVGVSYSDSADANAQVFYVDKFANYNNPQGSVLGAEVIGNFDFSGSGTAMNPFATNYQTALAKIVAGWEGAERAYGDLYGFVPNGRLGIYRTGNGQAWVSVENPTDGAVVATLTDVATGGNKNVVEVGDTITIDDITYTLLAAKDEEPSERPVIEVAGTKYYVNAQSNMFVGKCVGDNCQVCDADDNCTDVSDIAMYVGTDGYYYLNTTGGNTVDAVYTMDKDNNFFVQKELQDIDYKNFEAMYDARGVSNVVANTSVIAPSRGALYETVSTMPFKLQNSQATNTAVFIEEINKVYDKVSTGDSKTQGEYADALFRSGSASTFVVMPAGEFKYGAGTGVLDATFENYAPVIYDSYMDYNFMTVVGVMHSNLGASGIVSAETIAQYGNGVKADYGRLTLSTWQDENGDIITSRKCGIAGVGLNGIDPWCFSAAGATAEMATASAAGAVASLKAAFPYMSNKYIYYLMALTADGYLLGTDASGNAFTEDTLAAYLKKMYALPSNLYEDTLSSKDYLQAFAGVYGYGLINLERAMSPDHKIYVYDGNNIVSQDKGNAYWRAAKITNFKPSSVLNLRGATIKADFYDVLQSVDGGVSLPRVWENNFALGVNDKRGLYMGDVLGEMKTRHDSVNKTQVGNMNFSMSMSERAYNDNLNGLDSLSLDYAVGGWNFGASYQRYLTDGASRFDGMANPVLGLVSNAVVSDVEYKNGKWAFGARVFSGAITDEGLLENDPTISAQYMPAKLGLMQGAQTYTEWKNDKFAFSATVGTAHETNTLLGAYTDGLLNLGNGNTTYVDALAQYRVNDLIDFTARATFAHTMADATGGLVLGMSDIDSNAFAFGANVGDFEFSVAQPLAITDGALQYAYADYDVIENANGGYELSVVDTHIANLGLVSDKREVRLSGTYRHKFGEFTDGAFGFIYRVNPNHTDDFGNESIFMMKFTHRLGI